jgi:hypothetical protein
MIATGGSMIEVVSSRDGRKGIEVVAPCMESLTPNAVRHHTTHAHSIVCVECARALSPEQARQNDAGEWVCIGRCQ